jgi:ComF family protein
LSNKFGGLIDYQDVHTFLIFSEGARVQKLMHQIKYKGEYELGEYLGAWCGSELAKFPDAQDYDLIIPIPLHKKRLRERGYNQASCIANGIAKLLKKECNDHILVKSIYSNSLIQQNRQDRFAVLESVFEVENPHLILNKHVLIVDDTLTTGATLLAAGEKLLEAGAEKISFLALAALK